ncbi:MAG: tripartite tricarboxylate transporter substrate binding protein [Burkholderiales bacterium]|nr:tripartite tricarboxylate transporter substrate binding protein [Burkholderiales bacterium]
MHRVLRCARQGWLIAAAAIAGTAFTLGSTSAFAQAYPYKPIRYIVPFAAGGATDIITRILAQPLAEALGQQVVVDNRPGAGAIIGTSLLAKAPADGYTLIMCEIAHGANPALHAKLPYDTRSDFASIAWVALMPTVLVVPPAFPAKGVQDLIALARAKPGQLNYASSGVGSANFLAAELFKSELGLDIVHVPFQGGGQAVTAILSGQAQLLFVTLPPSLPHVKSGRLRVLAVSSGKRLASLPDIATIAETSVKGFDVSLWIGTFAPAGTPQPVIRRLNSEINKALSLPATKERIEAVGGEVVGGTPEQLSALVNAEIERWRKTIKPEMRAK